MRAYLIAPALALALGVATPAAAGADDELKSSRLNVPKEQWLPATQIAEKLAAQGYKVIEIESDDGAYEVEMTDKNGVHIEGHVHPATAELLTGYGD